LLKRFFLKKEVKKETPEIKENKIKSMVCLMIEVSRIDGNISKSEVNLIKKFISEFKPGINIHQFYEEAFELAHTEESLNAFIDTINRKCTKKEKLFFLETLWKVIQSDDEINPYENSLYLRISELMKVKRSIANRIKIN